MAEGLHPPELNKGRYRHYKGGEYEVVNIACHSETLEWYVLYRPVYEAEGPDLWIRPYGMFFGSVEVDGVETPRFLPIDK